MNTRQAIQPTDNSVVLSVAFSPSSTHFIAALSNGIRMYRTENCQTINDSHVPQDGGFAVAEALDDQYLAFVGGGRSPSSSPNVLIFWDAWLDREVNRFDFHEAIVGVRLHRQWMLVLLHERAVLFQYQKILSTTQSKGKETDTNEHHVRGPNKVVSIINTAHNPFAIGCINDEFMLLPATTPGQIQLIYLQGSASKRVHRVHNSALQCIAVSPDRTQFATASAQGTLLRIFDVHTFNQTAEFRRGVDTAIIFAMAFSPSNRWLACTSDKGTLHIFDLKPALSAEEESSREKKRRSNPVPSRFPPSHRFSDTSSAISSADRSAPSTATGYQGSIQEYYGLRPPPSTTSQGSHGPPVSAIAAIKASALAPRIFKDPRSLLSAPFYMGNDPPYWQGGLASSWTITPNGTRKRITHPIPSRPGNPAGKPPKGVLAFDLSKKTPEDTSDDRAIIYILGGGSDPRWEQFELLPNESGWVLYNRGFRKFLTRQFTD